MSKSSESDTDLVERRANGTPWKAFAGVAALLGIIGMASPYAAGPKENERQDREIALIKTLMDLERKEREEDRKLMSAINAKVEVLLRRTDISNRYTPTQP